MRFVALFCAAAVLSGATITLQNINVVDVESGTIRPPANVIITGALIKSIGKTSRGRIINAKGKFLIPGLWDMHVHLWEKQPMFDLYVANGVLGVRDMGSELSRTLAWKAEIDARKRIGPRIYTCGSPIDGSSDDQPKMPVIHARSADEGRRAVDTLDTHHADFINVLSMTSLDAYFALAQRARVIRAVFAGHVPESVTVWQALDARQKSMEHLFGLALACSSEEQELRQALAEAIANKDSAALRTIRIRAMETFSEPRARMLFEKMRRFDAWQTPTMSLLKRLALIDLDALATDPLLPKVPADVRATWEDPREDLKKSDAETGERLRNEYIFQQKLVAMMQREGVGILAGTDTGDPYVLPGSALHEELQALVDAGLTPVQALRTATLNPARYFGVERLAGTIAPGKRADLVVLSANPLTDIRNTRKISAVILRGELVNTPPKVAAKATTAPKAKKGKHR